MVILGQMIILYVVMLAGYAVKKWRILPDNADKTMSGLVINITNPALIIASGIENANGGMPMDVLWKILTFGIIYFVVILLIAWVMPVIIRADNNIKGAYRVMTVFSNCSFMGYPLLTAMVGTKAILFAAMFSLPFNFLIYTYGVWCMLSDNNGGHARDAGPLWKKMCNPGVVSSIVGVLIFVLRIPVPEQLGSVCSMLGNMTPPLSMLVIGMSLTELGLGDIIKDVRMLGFMVLKLVAIPILGFLAIAPFGLDEVTRAVFFINIATPVAAMTAMLAREYDSNYALAAKGVAVSTLLSAVTMPLCLYLFF